MIDEEVKSLLDEAYARALGIVKKYKHQIQMMTDMLIKHETLGPEDVIDISKDEFVEEKLIARKKAAEELHKKKPVSPPPPPLSPDQKISTNSEMPPSQPPYQGRPDGLLPPSK